MKTTTNRLTEEQQAEVRKRLAKRQASVPSGYNPFGSQVLPEGKPQESAAVPVGYHAASIGRSTTYKGRCGT
jgi:hypothetical protein